MAVPETLEESAKIDGANHFTILFRLILPLSMPVIAVMILYYAVEKWNGWFYASIFLKDRDLFPLQLILREILIANSTDSMSAGASAGDQIQIGETIKYATIMVATLPISFSSKIFNVTSTIRKGKIVTLSIRSTLGGICRVRNPWGEQQVSVKQGDLDVMMFNSSLLEFDTVAGEVISIYHK